MIIQRGRATEGFTPTEVDRWIDGAKGRGTRRLRALAERRLSGIGWVCGSVTRQTEQSEYCLGTKALAIE
jgi:hypothetical protein